MKRTTPVFLFCILFFYACSPTRQLGEDQFLLHKNVIKTNAPGLRDGTKSILKQKANRKILGLFRFHLGVYSLGNRGKPNKFKNWLKYTVGEEPVILDTTQTSRSVKQIRIFMENNGYFNSIVTDTTIYKRKKAIVKYRIRANEPYTVFSITRNIEDSVIAKIILSDTASSIAKPGQVYSADKLQKERERLTTLLKDSGYYFFNTAYINYTIDSSLKNKTLKVFMDVSNPEVAGSSDSSEVSKGHLKYHIKNIYINTAYDPILRNDFSRADTLLYDTYYFISTNRQQRVKPRTIVLHTLFKQDDLYNTVTVEKTYRRLNDLGLYKFVNIYFNKSDYTGDSSKHFLNAFINLTPFARQDYKFEIEGTNNGGNLGVASDVTYRNKNTFHGGELFEIRLRGALESQKNFSGGGENRNLGFFNTYEAGIENTLKFPRALWPFKAAFKTKASNPISVFTAGFNTQNRPEFRRNIFDFGYSLEFRQSKFIKFIWTPAQMNFVNVDLDPLFVQNLSLLDDPVLLSSYTNHLIANGKLSFIFNNQELSTTDNFFLLRCNLETAGNIIRAAKVLSEPGHEEYDILNQRFAQYIRPDVDLRFYHVLSKQNTIVYRISGGVGFSYLNSQFLPFEKSFYAGGSNDLRAFKARSLGPGADSTTYNFERIGDLKINGNIEYRYDIFKVLKGAFFLDAGNIWLLKSDTRKAAVIKSNRFLHEIAIGSGLGFRFDFTFFIFRLDIGVPLRDPSYPLTERWMFNKLEFSDLQYNFGIGYPF